MTSSCLELFREDASLDHCDATIVAIDAAGIRLARTVFYPHGGGQAGDRGELAVVGGPTITIADTRKGTLPGQIAQLRTEGYIVFATLQYNEHYVYYAPPDQQAAFAELAAAGASVVSGSQAHHAQTFAFDNGTFIHYGPGNLFFDQMDMMGTRQTFVPTYIIYDGRLMSVELWTGLIENWARPRVMTAEERADLLQTVFTAGGW